MSLVAYDSSDEGSENEEHELAQVNINDTKEDPKIETRTSSKLTLPAPTKVISQNINNEREENDNMGSFKQFLNTLPKPKDLNSAENVKEDFDDVLFKSQIESQTVKPAKRQTVKITVPSLSEFKDLENEPEESEKKSTKILKLPEKGCGLFSVLVPPKEETAKKILIPHSVKSTKSTIQRLEPLRKSGTDQLNNPKMQKSTTNKHNEFSSDDEEDITDYFGLTTSKDISDTSASTLDVKLPEETLANGLDIKETSPIKHVENNTIHNIDSPSISSYILTNDQSNDLNKTLTSNVMNLPKEDILLKNKAEIGPKLPVPEQEYNVDTEGNVAFDEKAIEYLCGKRGIKRKDKEFDEANIIEINGEDIKPDEREWLVKALTEERVQRPISMQNCGINPQTRKKHQITYLAQQAKAMELELQNQWSQNRMTRKQTKSKYGF